MTLRSATHFATATPARGRRSVGLLFALCSLLWTSTVLAQSTALSQSALTSAAAPLGNEFVEQEFLPVEEAYPLAVEPISSNTLLLIWQMPPGYYLYQHAFRFEFSNGTESSTLTPEFPSAIVREDEFFGRVEVYYDGVDIELLTPGPLAGGQLRVTSQGCADAGLCYPPRTQTFNIDENGEIREINTPARRAPSSSLLPSNPAPSQSLLFMMLLAFAGGIILNLMPCVLPILSLKVLGFASAPVNQRRRHGWLYSAGVILSFLLVAGILLGLRGAGQAIGWGFQLQSPGFVIGLAYLFVVMGLALSGMVELGSRFMNLGSDLAQSGGSTGSFFTGVLAVVVASPCTAPFMGTALGYALVQPPAQGLSVFAALGAGMAAPMLLLSYSETARKYLPRPGVWMERLKQALAFPLYATALWLFWVAGRQTSVDVMAATLFGALLIALGLWLWRGSFLAKSTALACLVVAIALATWRPAHLGSDESTLPAGTVAYTPESLNQLIAEGQPVFVDVTADWCITCLANERAVLLTTKVQEAFRDAGVTYMIADWTDYDPIIADFVASHGRSGIPLYVLYTGPQAPTVLPQLLRTQTVLKALEGVAGP
ncbi:protein-disulfide reductase DsbD [Congregibacter variabilis]|uniref:Protein-disulfide reductase DsbD n=1 Tax=Congregibacter variabilis TaxID=3081200 RepID=A0ABZ0I1R8_9GAMM|nr:protein-disulfide reductase DsbD [Congregibacter sp. IMCC43200]